MKQIFHILFIAMLLCGGNVWAQNDRFAVGAQEAGTGYAAQTRSNAFSIFNNTAGLATLSSLSVGAYAENRFLVDNINLIGLGLALPTQSGTFGLGVFRYGNNTYNETKMRLGYGRVLADNLSIGASFELGSFSIQEYGSRYNFTFDLSFQYSLLENLRIGANIYNPLRIQITDSELDKLPTMITFGASYQPSQKVAVHLETQKNLDYPVTFRGGIDYRMLQTLSLRMGFVSNPNMATMGVGLHLKTLQINLAGTWHPSLGYSPHIDVQYQAAPKQTQTSTQEAQ